jgi:SAM-dependent methyltransferase
MRNLWDSLVLLPTLAKLSSRVPKNPHTAWERYWAGISHTGRGGQVLWDAGAASEQERYEEQIRAQLDPALPVIDVGCGNGTFTRWLAGMFPEAIGVDVSGSAVARAGAESGDVPNARFLAVDATADGAAGLLREAAGGDANVFLRGVLHVLDPAEQARLAANLHALVGRRGRVFPAETNFQGNRFQYVAHLGADRRGIPGPLRRAIEGLPMPGHFGRRECRRVFDPAAWELLAEGPAVIEAVPMKSSGSTERIPGYFAALRALG